MPEKGFIHIYYGDGKGKTTAALGLAVRAAGCGKKVVIAQFLKGWNCGEHNTLMELPNIKMLCAKPASNKFVNEMNDEERLLTEASQNECLNEALELVEKGDCDVLILDEIIDTLEMGVVDVKLFEKAVYEKANKLELVLTGHNPDLQLLKQADYVTEMVKHKHPYDAGINARKGIEF
ncbi:MAG: cob(I)yrinic acid a,c-diamide adenosyltransferase [Oscillospiraceae bacterium]|nr:cob(I)yrinic acid a,c-diamide adenosyltransferase [Oscillospiraceae bacterium]